jgi:hypothetical protein
VGIILQICKVLDSGKTLKNKWLIVKPKKAEYSRVSLSFFRSLRKQNEAKNMAKEPKKALPRTAKFLRGISGAKYLSI